MNSNKTLAKAEKKASKNAPQDWHTNLQIFTLRPGKDKEMPSSKVSLQKPDKGSEEQSGIAREIFKKKYNLDLDIEEPNADYTCKCELLRKSDDK